MATVGALRCKLVVLFCKLHVLIWSNKRLVWCFVNCELFCQLLLLFVNFWCSVRYMFGVLFSKFWCSLLETNIAFKLGALFERIPSSVYRIAKSLYNFGVLFCLRMPVCFTEHWRVFVVVFCCMTLQKVAKLSFTTQLLIHQLASLSKSFEGEMHHNNTSIHCIFYSKSQLTSCKQVKTMDNI